MYIECNSRAIYGATGANAVVVQRVMQSIAVSTEHEGSSSEWWDVPTDPIPGCAINYLQHVARTLHRSLQILIVSGYTLLSFIG